MFGLYSRANLFSAVIRGQGRSTIQGAFVMTIVGFLGQAHGIPLNLHSQEQTFSKPTASFRNVFLNQNGVENLSLRSSPFYTLLEMPQIQKKAIILRYHHSWKR